MVLQPSGCHSCSQSLLSVALGTLPFPQGLGSPALVLRPCLLDRMVSCGRDSIRLWRVRSRALHSCPVALGEYHSLDFTDLAFEERPRDEQELENHAL